MKTLILILLSLSSLNVIACSEEWPVIIPDNCKGKTDPLTRKLVDVSTDLPKGMMTHSDDIISLEMKEQFLHCLEEFDPEWHWIRPYVFKKTKYYRSCYITMSSVCEPKMTTKKMDWYCDTSPDTCGRPIHPPKYVIETNDFSRQDEEAIKKLNAKVTAYDREEIRRFAYNDEEKFLKFKVRWTRNKNFSKACEKYKGGI